MGVYIEKAGHLHTFAVSDNYFWLDANEEAIVEVENTEGLSIVAFNFIGSLKE